MSFRGESSSPSSSSSASSSSSSLSFFCFVVAVLTLFGLRSPSPSSASTSTSASSSVAAAFFVVVVVVEVSLLNENIPGKINKYFPFSFSIFGVTTADRDNCISRPLHICCNNEPGRNADALVGRIGGFDVTGKFLDNIILGFIFAAVFDFDGGFFLLLVVVVVLGFRWTLTLIIFFFDVLVDDADLTTVRLALVADDFVLLLVDDFLAVEDGAMIKKVATQLVFNMVQ